jgi:hypothetical protein
MAGLDSKLWRWDSFEVPTTSTVDVFSISATAIWMENNYYPKSVHEAYNILYGGRSPWV